MISFLISSISNAFSFNLFLDLNFSSFQHFEAPSFKTFEIFKKWQPLFYKVFKKKKYCNLVPHLRDTSSYHFTLFLYLLTYIRCMLKVIATFCLNVCHLEVIVIFICLLACHIACLKHIAYWWNVFFWKKNVYTLNWHF